VTVRRVSAILIVALTWVLVIAGRAQSPSGDLILPPGAFRPPIVLIVAGPEPGAPLADALKANGVASFRYSSPDADHGTPSPGAGAAQRQDALVRAAIERLTSIRNDARFPTVSVIGRGATAGIAAIAARLGRADGFVSIAPQGASADIARLIVPVLDVPKDDGAKAIADFVRGVPTLGRRGTREPRPASPRLSPRAVAIGTIGGTLVGIEYGQPQRRGRTIWGALVSWDRVWMPGADEATTLSTSLPVSIGDLAVPAGDHTFYLWPREDRVALIVSRDVGQFHTVYNPQQELGRADMTLTRRTDGVEGLTFALEPRDPGGLLKIIWDDREYSVPITAGARTAR
jgi:hypothetical protein